jgi:hypothetical protein
MARLWYASRWKSGLAKEPQHGLIGLAGERERGLRQLLAGLEREHVGGFLVGIGEGQIGRAGLEGIDHLLGEVFAILHHREGRAQIGRLRAHFVQRELEVGEQAVNIGVEIKIVCADLEKVKGRCIDGAWLPVTTLGLNFDLGRTLFVEDDLELVAAQKIDAVEGGVFGEAVELGAGFVVLAGKVGADGVAADFRLASAAGNGAVGQSCE